MIGAIAGDIIGSVFEHNPTTDNHFTLFSRKSRFTDDTVLTVATADALMNNKDYAQSYKDWFNLYPRQGYGGSFKKWAQSDSLEPYGSWGNGSAMRVSPVGWFFNSLNQTLEEARRSSAVTHNHPDAIAAAQAVAGAIFLARKTKDKQIIYNFLRYKFGYELDKEISEIQADYHFDVSAKGSVPQAIIAFLKSTDYESAVRNAVLLGGDADTQACIAGAIAQAFYPGMGLFTEEEIYKRLDKKLAEVVKKFTKPSSHNSAKEYLPLFGNDFWCKPLENHQQNWALINHISDSQNVAVYFMNELSGVFDRLMFNNLDEAVLSLRKNYFLRYSENEELKEYFGPPEAPFYIAPHPKGYIYSSGKYWHTKTGQRYV